MTPAEIAAALEALADEAPEYEPPEAPAGLGGYPRTDLGNAEAFASLHGGKVIHNYQRGQWLTWGGHRWIPDTDGAAMRLAKETVRARRASARELEGNESALMASWGMKSESAGKIKALLELAKAERAIADSGKDWDMDPDLLGVDNGVVNLRTGELRNGRPSDHISLTTDIVYDPTAACPRWERWLCEVFEDNAELIDFLQVAIGYTLTGHNRSQVWFLCSGHGSNGKSVLLDVLNALLGDYGAVVAASTLKRQYGGGGATNDLARLAGKRLAAVREMAEATLLDEEKVKSLTHGDQQSARFLYQETFEFTSVVKLWLATNYLPEVRDASEGFWRSVRVVPFNRRFEGAEKEEGLGDWLIVHELAGIFAWAVRGAMRWFAAGLPKPASVMMATLNYRQDSDPLADWISAKAVAHKDARAKRGQLYASYLEWCEEEKIPARERLGEKNFGRKVGERFTPHKSGPNRFFLGIGLHGDPLTPQFDAVTVPVGRRAPYPCASWCVDNHPDVPDARWPSVECEEGGYYDEATWHCASCHPKEES